MLGREDGLLLVLFFLRGPKQQSPLLCLLCWGRGEDGLEKEGGWCNPPLAGFLLSSKVKNGSFRRTSIITQPCTPDSFVLVVKIGLLSEGDRKVLAAQRWREQRMGCSVSKESGFTGS